MVSLRPCRTIHSPAFVRFDEILYLVEKTSDLTLPAFGRCHIRVAKRDFMKKWDLNPVTIP
jgi:hypothetical protein